MDREWPLVGRAAELALVEELLLTGAAGVVLAGPAGVGKTRLATECLALAATRGLVPLRVAATQAASGVPFGAYASLLPDLSPGDYRTEVLGQVTRAMLRRGEGARVGLLVDDAHLLDGESAALTHQLAASPETFVLVTVRSGEPASDAVTALWKDGLAERLELAPLTEGEVDALLTAVLGAPADGATVHLFWERTEGNALFLKEAVLGAVEAGILSDNGGVWRLRGPLPASARLVELVEARLAGLGEAERDALSIVAVGEPLGADLLPGADARRCLDALERRGLVRIHVEDRRLQVRLAHPIYGDVLRARLSPLRTRELSRTLAELVERTGARRREDLLRATTWRLDGGGEMRADLMMAAAEQARLRGALPLAERLARAALEAGAGFPSALLLGQLFLLQGRAEEAERYLAAQFDGASDDAQRTMLASLRMDNLMFGLGRHDDATRVAEEAERAIGDQGARDAITVKRAVVLGQLGRTAAALRLVEPVLGRAEGQTLVWATMVAAGALGLVGRVREAVEAAERGLALHHSVTGLPLTVGPHLHVCQRCLALTNAGQLRTAEVELTREYERAVAGGTVEAQAMVCLYLSHTMLARGRIRQVALLARTSVGLHREMGWPPLLRLALVPLASALALGGSLDEARSVLAEIDALGLPLTDLGGDELLRARAWTEVAAGDHPAARRHLEAAVDMANTSGNLTVEAAALHDLARLGHARGVVPRLHELSALVEGDLTQARLSHAIALGGGDAPSLEAVSGAFEGMGADLLAAEAAVDAAVAWRNGGDPRKAAAAERRAHVLVARCEGARTPALGAVAARVVLSARELEIARLAAAGVSNKEIAARLFLSVRTVENKLHAAYEKLGIEGRPELAESLEGA